MKKFIKNEKYLGLLLVGIAFLLMFIWAMIGSMPTGPDEGMRYQVARYLYRNPGKLPRGEDEAIRNSRWGISYGFSPILSYMVSAVFMWITKIFTTEKMALLRAARMADVLFMTAAAWLVVRIGKRLFQDKGQRWLFCVLVIFLPEFLFMGAYVNTDSLALLSCTIILLAWVRYLDEGWTWKNCILLAVGMGVCFLSYYNAYGWILWSAFFFCFTVLFCTEKPWKERWRFLFSRGFVIAGITFALAGWWFIRNYFLYDGDILGRKASDLCAEKYAWPDFKPSVRMTPEKLGWSYKDFFLYQDPGWQHNWIISVLYSFIGTFGVFDIFMNENMSKIYVLFLTVGILGVTLMLREFYWKKTAVSVAYNRGAAPKEPVKIKTISRYREWNQMGVFNLAMAGAMITPVFLFISYAYSSDNQAQGRYILSAVFPLMYFVTKGYGKLLEKFVKKEELRKLFYRIASILWTAGAVITFATLIIPKYVG